MPNTRANSDKMKQYKREWKKNNPKSDIARERDRQQAQNRRDKVKELEVNYKSLNSLMEWKGEEIKHLKSELAFYKVLTCYCKTSTTL